MEFRDYFRILTRRGWIVVLVCIVTALSAVLFSKLQPVVYRSSAKLQVIPARYDYGLTMAADLLLRQFALQIQTPDMAWQVIQCTSGSDLILTGYQGFGGGNNEAWLLRTPDNAPPAPTTPPTTTPPTTPPPPIPGFPAAAIAIGTGIALGLGIITRKRKQREETPHQ